MALGLCQLRDGRPLAYYSKGLGPKHIGLSIYEKEYLSIINAVDKWDYIIKADTLWSELTGRVWSIC